MEDLLVRRRILKGKITRLEKVLKINDPDPLVPDEGQVSVYTGQVIALIKELDHVQDGIGLACNEDEFSTHEAELDNMSFRIDSIQISLTNFKLEIDTRKSLNSSINSSTTQPVSVAKIQLPKLDLPTFHGSPEDWISFHDLFISMVHKNKTLANSQKLQYLKVALKGDASHILQSVQVTDDNYEEAWTILTKRYQHLRQIVYSHLKRLINQPSIITESASALRKLVDTTMEGVRALRVLKHPIEAGPLLGYLITDKLDSETKRQWSLSLKDDRVPSFEEFFSFIEQRASALAESTDSKPKTAYNSKPAIPTEHKLAKFEKSKSYPKTFHAAETHTSNCKKCEGDHRLIACDQFRNSPLKDKWTLVRQFKLCSNCLGPHPFKSCPSNKRCVKCNQSHHTLLHKETPESEVTTPTPPQEPSVALPNQSPTQGASIHSHVGLTQGLLSTALVQVNDAMGRRQYARLFIDGGSQSSFLSEALVKRLGLKRHHSSIPVHGLGSTLAGTARGMATCTIFSRIDPNFSLDIEALILQKITGDLPNTHIDTSLFNQAIHGLTLADPDFARPGKVDILIGVPHALSIIRDGIRLGRKGIPFAQNSHLGWLLSGEVNTSHESPSTSTTAIVSCHSLVNSEFLLQKFWELEELHQDKQNLSMEEKKCESHFNETITRNSEGQFVVKFPFKEFPEFGDSRRTALMRFQQVERKIHRSPDLLDQYTSFMEEYQTLGHMTCIPHSELKPESKHNYYLPHHAVLKPDSTTTKLRVVFDGSCKSSNNRSLNDSLMVGPKIQQDLADIILRFRTHRIAFCADIAKMYRQILIHPDHRNFQRIVWRKSPEDPILDFQLNTVTYGTSSAPYQAVKCLQTLAIFEATRFPEASEIILRDFYVDDLITGAVNVKTAQALQSSIREVCEKANFPLRKFSSNSQELLDSIPADLKATQDLVVEFDSSVVTLGLRWHPAVDNFTFAVSLPEVKGSITKRTLLSDVARIFDPLGWLSPIVITCKILLQQLWKENLNWDDPLPEPIRTQWLNLRDSLSTITSITIPRWLGSIGPAAEYQLHGFSDASQVAYSAVVYLRTLHSNRQARVSLVSAKTKVAPIKTVTIPRLELCGAALVSRLLSNVKRALCLPIQHSFGWTDSTIVLSWLNNSPNKWKTFVANRVSEIQDSANPISWNHIKSEENPADCASRGIPPEDLKDHPLWWHGPSWLSKDRNDWPRSQEPGSTELELKPINTLTITTAVDTGLDILSITSSWHKLKRMVAWWIRFWDHLRSKSHQHSSVLIPAELQRAQEGIIRSMQRKEFQTEIKLISSRMELPKGNRLRNLNVFLDEKGVLRVGGRLTAAPIPHNQKYPILLPQKNLLTDLIITEQHIQGLHSGPRLLLTSIQQQFWILRGMDAVRRITHRCVKCIRQKAKTAQQLMGDLPRARTELIRPFLKSGVDYAGPVTLRLGSRRSKQYSKAYICLFVCMATKATHLELVTDLTTAAFIAALRRFIARRGKRTDMYSDNGTNFVGAKSELEELHQLVRSSAHNEFIAKTLGEEGIRWHFNPPASPHQGGLWEAAVKSAKYHLRRVIGASILNFEEYSTILCQVEACLNSRPLCGLQTSPNDTVALTPGHFLIGEPLNSVPEPDLGHLPDNRLDYWQKIQSRTQDFWKRWSSEYLVTLQQRAKWTTQFPNMTINDLVIVKEDNLPPTQWRLGRIVAIHPGKDGKVRNVSVKCESGTYKRSVVKLCPLPNE